MKQKRKRSRSKPQYEPLDLPPDFEPNGRPLSLAWISDDLMEQTIEVWSKRYGRRITNDEAIEILMNVKRFAEVLLKITDERAAEAAQQQQSAEAARTDVPNCESAAPN